MEGFPNSNFSIMSFGTFIKDNYLLRAVAQLCLTLCDPMDCSTPGLPVHHQLSRVYPNPSRLSRWCHPTISSSLIPFFSRPQSFPASESFQMSQLFASGDLSIGVSASTSVLPMNARLISFSIILPTELYSSRNLVICVNFLHVRKWSKWTL